jgi:hypothetical protein
VVNQGQVVGDDDIMENRPFKATLTCAKNNSFLYEMPKNDFCRYFKKLITDSQRASFINSKSQIDKMAYQNYITVACLPQSQQSQ